MQTAQINIPSTVQDPNYRYKMPKMTLKIEGKGNGIKTNIVNMADVAKALRVPTDYPLKFLGFELGSQTTFKEKDKHSDTTTIINGAFSDTDLAKGLDKFIEKYILCPECKYPEMVMRVRKGQVQGKCDSCGKRSILDNQHKMATYIQKNPPKQSGIQDEKEEEKKDKNSNGKKVTDTKPTSGKSNEKKDNKSAENQELVIKLKKPEEITLQFLNDYSDKLREIYNNQINQDEKINDYNIIETDFIRETKQLTGGKGCEDKIAYLILNSIFTVNINFEIQRNTPLIVSLFKRLNIINQEIQIMMSLQQFLLVNHQNEKFSQYIPTILKTFYDADLLTEEFLVNWDDDKIQNIKEHFLFNEEQNKAFKQMSRQILDWLKSSVNEDEQEEQEATDQNDDKEEKKQEQSTNKNESQTN